MKPNTPTMEVTSDNFQQQVLDRSREIPVLVDFWASWCAPCKMLVPILSGLASEYEGRLLIAKVDTDQQQQLALEYGVRSLPTVKLFKDAQAVDEFNGALPERAVREFIERHLPRPADDLLELADHLVNQGKFSEGQAILKQALEDDPNYDKLKLKLAKYQYLDGGTEQARITLKGVTLPAQQDEDFKGLLARIEIREIALSSEEQETLATRLEKFPNDHDSRRRLSAVLFDQGETEPAMDHLLRIVRSSQGEIKASGQESLLQMFQALGSSDDRISRYRRLLAQALN